MCLQLETCCCTRLWSDDRRRIRRRGGGGARRIPPHAQDSLNFPGSSLRRATRRVRTRSAPACAGAEGAGANTNSCKMPVSGEAKNRRQPPQRGPSDNKKEPGGALSSWSFSRRLRTIVIIISILYDTLLWLLSLLCIIMYCYYIFYTLLLLSSLLLLLSWSSGIWDPACGALVAAFLAPRARAVRRGRYDYYYYH